MVIDKFPERVEAWHRKHPFIDVACHGEGERIFLNLAEALSSPNPDLHGIAGISFIDSQDKFIYNPKPSRIGAIDRSLEEIPSPFLTGAFDALMKAYPDQPWLGLWETNRGCPFSCNFCDWGSMTAAAISRFSQERCQHELEWFAQYKFEFIFVCDANFGILDRDIEIARYAADVRRRTGYPHRLSVQNTKNRTENSYKVQKILFEAKLNNAVVMALQSVNPDTLKAIERWNISHDTYHEVNRRLAALGAETMSELILGMPLESYDTFVNGVCQIIERGQHNRIQFNNASILPNTPWGDPEYQKRYGMEIVEIPVANIHGVLTETEDNIIETQELVVGTSTCPKEMWAQTRAFAWMVGTLYFNKVAQIPIIVLWKHFGVPLREIFEIFSNNTFEQFPVLNETRKFFIDKASAIQGGDYEFCNSPDYLNIWWPPEEYMLIKLYAEGKLDAFYKEMEKAFILILRKKGISGDPKIIRDAVRLNRGLLKLPFQKKNLQLNLSYSIWKFYRSVVLGKPIKLKKKSVQYKIDRTSQTWHSLGDWCRKVIWWGNKKGAYLYGHKAVDKQISGHY